jgi:hypothetical protein
MKLSSALKQKNRLKKEISDLRKKIEKNNSVVKGNIVSYNVVELLGELNQKTEELVSLKTSITEANYPVQQKIYRMAELKGLIQFYKSVPVTDGKKQPEYHEAVVEYSAQLKDKSFDDLIKKAETEIEVIQEELDTFNYATELQ